MRAPVGVSVLVLLLAAGVLLAGDPKATKKKKALKDHPAEEWVYDDLEAALAVARREAKPLFLVFR
ncbi:MAG: hypothetical protein ACYSUM_00565 [Planctomycetota bacterium]|jgi:hypothetical protein